jgi:hypothetical protein
MTITNLITYSISVYTDRVTDKGTDRVTDRGTDRVTLVINSSRLEPEHVTTLLKKRRCSSSGLEAALALLEEEDDACAGSMSVTGVRSFSKNRGFFNTAFNLSQSYVATIEAAGTFPFELSKRPRDWRAAAGSKGIVPTRRNVLSSLCLIIPTLPQRPHWTASAGFPDAWRMWATASKKRFAAQ